MIWVLGFILQPNLHDWSGKVVTVDVVTTDRHGRSVGIVTVDGVNLNRELVKGGYAWVYDRYCKASFCGDWKGFEKDVRDNRAGLWVDRNPQALWTWRKERR
jgi:endonuclease YncB( thermonuclease family)